MGVACKICGGTDTKLYCRKEPVDYQICKSCGTIFQKEFITDEKMVEYADSEYEDGGYTTYVQSRDMKLAHFRRRLEEITPFIDKNKHKRLLDIGCSCGYFMETAMEAGYDVYGMEFSEVAISYARPDIQERIIRGNVRELKESGYEKFDIVTGFDIIEHVEEPVELLKQIREVLNPGGVLFLATPDTGHKLRYIMRSNWSHLQPYQHICLFSRKSLKMAMEQAGYKDIQTDKTDKILTYDYLVDLFEQLKLNPALCKMGKGMRKIIPEKLRKKEFCVNISEFFAVGYA